MSIDEQERLKQDLIAQWAFDTRSILGRLHLWLEDVEEVALAGGKPEDLSLQGISFMSGQMERLMAMTMAVTALGTKLYGRFGEGAGKPKEELNQVKKDADAISAYAMSESLWYASRQLPENHAIMVSLGEGLMPKAGETPEMGSNPQLGFGRIYARPQVAQLLEKKVARLINDPGYGWDTFYAEIKGAGITVWGAAIDTLENTSRFAVGQKTGPMTVMHLFNQPLRITRPYEGYMGNLFLPRLVVEKAEERSVLLDFHTPRAQVLEAIEAAYPGIRRQDIHVWTLRGKSRVSRIGTLWEAWQALGVHLVDEGWKLPSGMEAFTDSGTYAPTHLVGPWKDEEGRTHLFICDGYAASAEAMQASSLAPLLGLKASLVVYTSKFKNDFRTEHRLMCLDPDAADFPVRLAGVLGQPQDDGKVKECRRMILEARDAGLHLEKRAIDADDFFPEKDWEVMALSGFMCPDPYTGTPGVERLSDGIFRVPVRLVTRQAEKRMAFTLRLMEKPDESRLVFNPLLIRFIYGEDFRSRPVKISDSGRIRNELQTLCSEALEYEGRKIRVRFDRIPPEVISPKNQRILLEVLRWYQENHPIWFSWLQVEAQDR
jgi:hypothetical protein